MTADNVPSFRKRQVSALEVITIAILVQYELIIYMFMKITYLRLIGVKHQFRADFLVKLLRSEEAKRNGSLLKRRALFVCLLRALGNIFVADVSHEIYKWRDMVTYCRSPGGC